MEPDDVSQIARFLRGQNLVDSDCEPSTVFGI